MSTGTAHRGKVRGTKYQQVAATRFGSISITDHIEHQRRLKPCSTSPSYIQTHAPRSAGPRARARVEKKAQRAGRESLQSGATVCEDKGGIEPTQLLPNPLRLTEIDDTLRITATECDAAAPLAQLAEQLTLNQ